VRPFRFDVNVGRAKSLVEWRQKARKIEDLGDSALTVPDHLTDLIAPIPALVSAAEATKHLRIGTNVLNNDLRHPVLVAREAATVDLLTDGRFELGLGAAAFDPNTAKRASDLIAEQSGLTGSPKQ
jgi:alkanesulfonate monooxygenase SsuD/methylene tetrahydromethanopterin reductase-like flavin-dependent oxidoreductase (luciferase family)